MKKLLFVNACIRENSRTEALARMYLEKYKDEYRIEEIRVAELNLCAYNAEMLRRREEDITNDRISAENYPLAHQFAGARCVVIAAPYWDCLFPAALRVYLEHICVAGITFAYSKGLPIKTCLTEKMICITTSGGPLPENSAAESFIREMGRLFGVEDVRFYAAEGLDLPARNVGEILQRTLDRMQ